MFDALHEQLREPLRRMGAEGGLPWDERLDAHVQAPTRDRPYEIRTFPTWQRCPLAEGIARCLTTYSGREGDPESPHALLHEPALVWLARSNPKKPQREPAVASIPKPELRYLLGVDAVLVVDALQWDTLQGHREWDRLVQVVDFGLALLARSEEGVKLRKRQVVDPWGIVARWGAGTLPDTRMLMREIEDGRQLELLVGER